MSFSLLKQLPTAASIVKEFYPKSILNLINTEGSLIFKYAKVLSFLLSCIVSPMYLAIQLIHRTEGNNLCSRYFILKTQGVVGDKKPDKTSSLLALIRGAYYAP